VKETGFVETINKKGETQDSMLAKWLAVITEKDIEDKTIIKNICEEQEEISMAVSTLARLSEDKITRQEYLRRQDDILFENKRNHDYKRMERELVHQGAVIAKKDETIADQAKLIAELRSQLNKK